jgi:EAL and modified HD-GYP domain-containing signal transduction protein
MPVATLGASAETLRSRADVKADLDGRPVFLARQAIFDMAVQLHAYEVLYRSTAENSFDGSDGCAASMATLDRVIHAIGLENLVDGQKVFLNLPGRLVLDEIHTILPPDRLTVELLETAMPSEDLVAACKKLRSGGYQLALDDVTSSALRPLLEQADVLKVDFRAVEWASRPALFAELRHYPGKLLAEKIDSKEDFDQAVDLGCHYVQGYFFCRPELMRGKELIGSQSVQTKFLRELSRPRLDSTRLEDLIRQDLSLTYKLLRYLTSSGLATPQGFPGVRDALSRIGEASVRKWGALAAPAGGGRSRPSELAIMSLIRGRFCEVVGKTVNYRGHPLDLYLVGLLACIDSVTGLPMEHVLSQLAVSQDVKAVLLQDPGAKRELSQIQALAHACERGAWAKVIELSAGMRITQPELAVLYYDAVTWADQVA